MTFCPKIFFFEEYETDVSPLRDSDLVEFINEIGKPHILTSSLAYSSVVCEAAAYSWGETCVTIRKTYE